MKLGLGLAAMILIAAATGAREQSKVQLPPLGFNTIDFSKEFWVSVADDHKLKGRATGALSYEQIKRMVIVRCNMHVPAGDWLDTFIRGWLSDAASFHSGTIPANAARDLRIPLLTVLTENQKGELGLLTIYSDVAFLELNGRYGMLLKKGVGNQQPGDNADRPPAGRNSSCRTN